MSSVNLYQALRFWATRWPDRVAVDCVGEEVSWGGLLARSESLAAGLAAAGVGHGDRIGMLMRNRVEFLEVLFAAFRLGAAATLLNIRFTPTEMVYPIEDAGVSLVVADTQLLPAMADAVARQPELKVYATEAGACFPALDQLRHDAAQLPDIAVTADDVALICYTSGTTGFPKGAMLTHGNIRESALACAVSSGLTFEDRVLVSLPMAYTWGVCQVLREGILTGATTTIVNPTGDPEALIDILVGKRITAWSAVVLLFERIPESPRFRTADFSNLRHVVTGAASRHLLQTWSSVGVPIRQAYGLTETAGHATLLFHDDPDHAQDSSGRALMNTDLRIIDEDGNLLPAGQPGEIVIRGPMVMKGYVNKPEETARTMIDGEWLRTGDTGILDEHGFLRVVDRSKDMLKSGGLNVYPAELERVIAGVPGLEEFAIIGVPSDRWGEVPMIVANGSQPVDLAALKARCRQELADYKRPHFVVEHGKPLPRTMSGKVLKRDLRLEYGAPPAHALSLKD